MRLPPEVDRVQGCAWRSLGALGTLWGAKPETKKFRFLTVCRRNGSAVYAGRAARRPGRRLHGRPSAAKGKAHTSPQAPSAGLSHAHPQRHARAPPPARAACCPHARPRAHRRGVYLQGTLASRERCTMDSCSAHWTEPPGSTPASTSRARWPSRRQRRAHGHALRAPRRDRRAGPRARGPRWTCRRRGRGRRGRRGSHGGRAR